VGEHGTARSQESLYYRSLVAELGLSEMVEFRGLVPQNRLALYYSAADICAMPSSYESFGMVAVEAMACQTPVVAFDVGGLAATIKDGKTGFLVAPGDGAAFADTLAMALASPNLEAIGRQARMSVQRYDWRSVARRTADLYRQVVEERAYAYPRASGSS